MTVHWTDHEALHTYVTRVPNGEEYIATASAYRTTTVTAEDAPTVPAPQASVFEQLIVYVIYAYMVHIGISVVRSCIQPVFSVDTDTWSTNYFLRVHHRNSLCVKLSEITVDIAPLSTVYSVCGRAFVCFAPYRLRTGEYVQCPILIWDLINDACN